MRIEVAWNEESMNVVSLFINYGMEGGSNFIQSIRQLCNVAWF